MPVFVAASTEPTLSDIENNSFLVSFDDYGASPAAAAEWALDQGITRAFVFTEPGPVHGLQPRCLQGGLRGRRRRDRRGAHLRVVRGHRLLGPGGRAVGGPPEQRGLLLGCARLPGHRAEGTARGSRVRQHHLHRHRRPRRHGHRLRGQQRGHRPHPPHQRRAGRPQRPPADGGTRPSTTARCWRARASWACTSTRCCWASRASSTAAAQTRPRSATPSPRSRALRASAAPSPTVGTTGTPPKSVPIKRIVNGQDVLVEMR